MGEEDQDQVRILISTQHAEVGTCHLSVTKKNKTEFLDICLVARDGSSLDSYSKDSYSSHFLADSTDSRV